MNSDNYALRGERKCMALPFFHSFTEQFVGRGNRRGSRKKIEGGGGGYMQAYTVKLV